MQGRLLVALIALTVVSPFLLFFSGCAAGGGQDSPDGESVVEVSRVIDGDTIEVSPEVNGIEDVRLIGVDAPETEGSPRGAQPYGAEASEFTEKRLEGRRVTLRFDEEKVDDYGRLLAYVYPQDGLMTNVTLLEKGYAQVATFPPNVRHLEEFRKTQREARERERGIWSLPETDLCKLADRGNDIGDGCRSSVGAEGGS